MMRVFGLRSGGAGLCAPLRRRAVAPPQAALSTGTPSDGGSPAGRAPPPPPLQQPQQQPQQQRQQQQQQQHDGPGPPQQQPDGRREPPPPPPGGGRPGRRELGWAASFRAATVASWSGLCYLSDPSELEARLAVRGMTLVASGRNEYTSWFIADGEIDAAAFARRSLQRRGFGLAPSRGGSTDGRDGSGGEVGAAGGASAGPGPGGGGGGEPDPILSAVLATEEPPPPPPRRERFVLLRGVQWSAPDLNRARVWGSLVRVWPKPLEIAPHLVAHDGVGDLALAMFGQLRPYLDQAEDAGIPVVFGGHSLGGALSSVLLALYRLHSRKRGRQPPPSCYTFGSPAVMAHAEGGGGDRVLEVLGLRRQDCRNFVLQNDPVPRAFLSVDPAYQALARLPVVQGLLQLREQLAGAAGAPLSPNRFLFEAVGQVWFISWSAQEGSQVVLLEPDELASELSLLGSPPGTPAAAAAADTPGAAAAPLASGGGGGVQAVVAAAAARLNPMATVQAVLDHHHGSYAQELEATAGRGLWRLAKAAAAGAGAPQGVARQASGEPKVSSR